VPPAERALIEDFWSERWGRGPGAWLESAASPYGGEGIELGERIRAWTLGGRGIVDGRYCHRWGNTGVVVTEDGTAIAVAVRVTQSNLDAHRASIARHIATLERDLAVWRELAAKFAGERP
jgi:hypothetical protein